MNAGPRCRQCSLPLVIVAEWATEGMHVRLSPLRWACPDGHAVRGFALAGYKYQWEQRVEEAR